MQIFILDLDPIQSATFACDRHVVKICTEVGQILTTALSTKGVSLPWKVTHRHHPLSGWTLNKNHATWALEYGLALCREYTHRYSKVHKTEAYLAALDLSPLDSQVPFEGFLQVIPEEFKGPDPVEAYRRYYMGDRIRGFATWKNRNPPDWFVKRP